jgi:hypothetical protein
VSDLRAVLAEHGVPYRVEVAIRDADRRIADLETLCERMVIMLRAVARDDFSQFELEDLIAECDGRELF